MNTNLNRRNALHLLSLPVLGGTALTAGQLVVDGSISSSTVTVDNGAILSGSGSVGDSPVARHTSCYLLAGDDLASIKALLSHKPWFAPSMFMPHKITYFEFAKSCIGKT